MQHGQSIHLRHDVSLKERALIISSLLSWPFGSQWTSGSSKVGSLTVRFFFYGNRSSACRPIPKLEDQAILFISPGAEWPSYTPRHWVPILVASQYSMGYVRAILIPGHHKGRLFKRVLLLMFWKRKRLDKRKIPL